MQLKVDLYQGEANAGRAYQYRKAFPLMITDWRKHWNEGNFPFYFVQLPALMRQTAIVKQEAHGLNYVKRRR
jgi:hypothetical protein